MCGFVGFCDKSITDFNIEKYAVYGMTDKIKHRGPDSRGYYFDDFVAFGFARLKIIDLAGGEQPMRSADGRYTLCFNGEIYNYKELAKEQTEKFGDSFKTESDTEVLMSLIIHYGKLALPMLRGMFAFVFYDAEEKTLLLARDAFGIKPLYYAVFDGCFMFASEIKALLPHPKFRKIFNYDVLPYYLQFQYVPTEETAFLGVKRLMPGNMLEISDGIIKKSEWFCRPVYHKKGYNGYGFFGDNEKNGAYLPYVKNAEATAHKLLITLKASVEEHSYADVPLGSFLSGGVDSGLIATLAKPNRVFTVGFKRADFDERSYALKTADSLGIPLTSLEIDADDFFECVSKVQYHSDEPYANLSAIPLYLIACEAKKSVGAVLSGEGADELFGGYEWYSDSVFGKVYRRLPKKLRLKAARRALDGRIGDFLRRNSGNAQNDFIGQAHIMTAEQAKELLSKPYKALKNSSEITDKLYSCVPDASLLRKKMYLDMNLWLPFDILSKADKLTMAASLELRVPYLDFSVLEIAQECGDRLLMKRKKGKIVFRRAASEVLDAQTAHRAKKGFPVPFRNWIRERKYADILKKAFTGATGRKFFDTDMLIKMLNAHVKGESNNARILYTVYAFIVWYEIFFENKARKVSENCEAVGYPFGHKLLNDALIYNGRKKQKDKNEYERVYTDNIRL